VGATDVLAFGSARFAAAWGGGRLTTKSESSSIEGAGLVDTFGGAGLVDSFGGAGLADAFGGSDRITPASRALNALTAADC